MGISEFAAEIANPFPKAVDPRPGSIHLEYRRCGKSNCRCAAGRPHGPYYVRRWWSDNGQRKAYVRGADLVAELAATSAWRAMVPADVEMRRSLTWKVR